MTACWKPWCPLPPTPIYHLFCRIIIFQCNFHACWCICPILALAYKVCCGRTWAPSFSVIHTDSSASLLWNWWPPKCYLSSQTNSTTDAVFTCIVYVVCWQVSWWMSDIFPTCSPPYISISWQWILMGDFSWYNLIIRLHFFMTSRMSWHSGYWV